MTTHRKALVAAYKDRKVSAGIFEIAGPGEERWVGLAPDLSTVWNRTEFQLRHGSHPSRSLQAAWTAHAGQGFGFRAVERLETEETGSDLARSLRARLAAWAEALPAERI